MTKTFNVITDANYTGRRGEKTRVYKFKTLRAARLFKIVVHRAMYIARRGVLCELVL